MLSAKRRSVTVEELEGFRIAIIGTGREGRSVAQMLRRELDSVVITAFDQLEGDAAAQWRRDFGAEVPVIVTSDFHDVADPFDIAIVSPGIPPHNPLVQGLLGRGIPLTSGTDLFFARHRDRIIAVTGSKGKSTTSALIHHLLQAHGVDAVLGGNLGIPLWDMDSADWIVAEVSSYQCHSLTHSPHTAVLTALFEEHLDWHGDFAHYAEDKLNLVANRPDHVVVNLTQERLVHEFRTRYPDLGVLGVGEGTPWTLETREAGTYLVRSGEPVLAVAELPLIGEHNAWNALLALQAVETVVPVDPVVAANALRSFRPLANRLEPVADPSGVVFLNDSLATNPPALAAALRALRDKKVIAIIGGFDRGVDDEDFRREILAHPIAGLIGIPDSGPEMLQRVERWFDQAGVAADQRPVLVPVSTMAEAVVAARHLAKPGDVVTLSPGAPSFGRYRDYQDRADAFIAAIRESARP